MGKHSNKKGDSKTDLWWEANQKVKFMIGETLEKKMAVDDYWLTTVHLPRTLLQAKLISSAAGILNQAIGEVRNPVSALVFVKPPGIREKCGPTWRYCLLAKWLCQRVLINWTDLHQQVIAGDELYVSTPDPIQIKWFYQWLCFPLTRVNCDKPSIDQFISSANSYRTLSKWHTLSWGS